MMCKLKRIMMKLNLSQNSKKSKSYSTRLMVWMVFMFVSMPIYAAANELDMEYFTAYQISKMHNIDDILIDNANTELVDSIILNLIDHHKQGELIRKYYNNQHTKDSLQESIQEALLSTEFSSWLNAKIADVYVEKYTYAELKSMYQTDYAKNTSNFSRDLNEYIKEQQNIRLRQSSNHTLIKKEFEDSIKLILEELPKTK